MDAQIEERTRVLSIGGWGRCGSTLLDMMLGQLPGFVSAGEIRELWLRGCHEDRPCGCGEPFSTCAFWTQVGDEAFGGWARLDLDRVLGVRYRRDRAWALPGLMTGASTTDADLGHYLSALERLIAAIATVAGASVVVDSSKLPTHNLLLQRCGGLSVRMVHLVRDSRGVAHSVRKHVVKSVTHGEPSLLPRYGSISTALRYDVYNGAFLAMQLRERRAGRSLLRVRYEDLVHDPRRWLLEIAACADPDVPTGLPFLHDSDRAVSLAPNHLVDGNPVRFAQGALPLRLDRAWQTELPARERRVVGVLTAPLLAGFGYPVRAVRAADAPATTATTSAAARDAARLRSGSVDGRLGSSHT